MTNPGTLHPENQNPLQLLLHYMYTRTLCLSYPDLTFSSYIFLCRLLFASSHALTRRRVDNLHYSPVRTPFLLPSYLELACSTALLALCRDIPQPLRFHALPLSLVAWLSSTHRVSLLLYLPHFPTNFSFISLIHWRSHPCVIIMQHSRASCRRRVSIRDYIPTPGRRDL